MSSILNAITSILLAGNFDNVGKAIESFLSEWWGVILGVYSAGAGIVGLIVGGIYWWALKTGDEQKIKQAKHLISGSIVTVIVIIFVATIVPILIVAVQAWYDNSGSQYLN